MNEKFTRNQIKLIKNDVILPILVRQVFRNFNRFFKYFLVQGFELHSIIKGSRLKYSVVHLTLK